MVVASLATLVLTTNCSDDATLSLGGEGVVAVSASLVLMTACSDDALSFSEGGERSRNHQKPDQYFHRYKYKPNEVVYWD